MRRKVAHAPLPARRVLINPPCRTGAEMSAFGDKADIKRYCEESPLLTQSGHAARARSPFDKEHALAALGDRYS
jgi:hypothetical protein